MHDSVKESSSRAAPDDTVGKPSVSGQTLPAKQITVTVNKRHVSLYTSVDAQTGEQVVNEVYMFKGRGGRE